MTSWSRVIWIKSIFSIIVNILGVSVHDTGTTHHVFSLIPWQFEWKHSSPSSWAQWFRQTINIIRNNERYHRTGIKHTYCSIIFLFMSFVLFVTKIITSFRGLAWLHVNFRSECFPRSVRSLLIVRYQTYLVYSFGEWWGQDCFVYRTRVLLSETS